MSARDDLADDLFDADDSGLLISSDESGTWRADRLAIADAILAAGYRKPRVIETLEELEELPEHVVIREDGGRIFERSEFLAINLSYDLARPWFSCAAISGLRTDTIRLPATVLYMPEES